MTRFFVIPKGDVVFRECGSIEDIAKEVEARQKGLCISFDIKTKEIPGFLKPCWMFRNFIKETATKRIEY